MPCTINIYLRTNTLLHTQSYVGIYYLSIITLFLSTFYDVSFIYYVNTL